MHVSFKLLTQAKRPWPETLADTCKQPRELQSLGQTTCHYTAHE